MDGRIIPEKRARNQAVEALRIISAFGIVAFHAGADFTDLAYAGLIVFLILSPMMDVRYHWDRRRTIAQLARALLLPWAFWMCVYGARNIAVGIPLIPQGNIVAGLLFGTSAQLWYLPFMFAVLVLLGVAKQRVRPSWLFWICAVAAAVILATVSLWRVPSLTWPSPLPQWMHAAPGVLVGVVLGLAGTLGRAAWLGVAGISCGLVVAVASGLPGIGIPYATGIIVTAAVALPQARWQPAGWRVQPVADCMMGVYLSHILFLQIFAQITGRGTYLTVGVAFTTALLAVWFARKAFPASKLVLG